MDNSKTEDGRPKGEPLDRAIDLAVREMMDAEPRADLRARVIEQIQRPHRVFNWTWVMVPIAAAAVIVLAVLLWQPQEPLPTRAMTQIVVRPDTRLPSPIAAREVLRHPAPPVRTVTPHDRQAHATLASADTNVGTRPAREFAVVDALAPPPPIVLEQISSADTRPVGKLDVAPLQLSALEVNALPDSPRERREE